MDRTIAINNFPEMTILGQVDGGEINLELTDQTKGIYEYLFTLSAHDELVKPTEVTLRWRIPSFNVQGVWTSASLHEKRQQYDWELEHLQSRVSVDAPVVSVFGHQDENIITFACSDAINTMQMNALLREEDNHLYCHLSFFTERHPLIDSYQARIRVDTRSIRFSEALQDMSLWWEKNDKLIPTTVPDLARVPLYSTWYEFHQSLDEERLYEECRLAREMGYELVILDDGWQTMDANRGYDYCGDWEAIRIPDMAGFVKNLHQIGIKVGLWFSVPFCGVHSRAYQRFKGKFLTENHRWAPVFDPRYPEVREYLINTYVNALKNYDLDAFKLDFIDDFKAYPETVLSKEDGRDYANVNEAVDRLMTDVIQALKAIKSDIAIEFRQKYIGPAMRKYGNMFRAFDCPNDAVSNRIRTTDVKLLCGSTAVHSDMFTWHFDEPVEIAALQMLNALFSVPQLSVSIARAPEDHRRMIAFYTRYWLSQKSVLLEGQFTPLKPLANYPILMAEKDEQIIYGVYDDIILEVKSDFKKTDIINAKRSNYIAVHFQSESFNCRVQVFDCQGNITRKDNTNFKAGLKKLSIPPAGLMQIEKL